MIYMLEVELVARHKAFLQKSVIENTIRLCDIETWIIYAAQWSNVLGKLYRLRSSKQ